MKKGVPLLSDDNFKGNANNLIGERARHSQVCSIEIRNIYIY